MKKIIIASILVFLAGIYGIVEAQQTGDPWGQFLFGQPTITPSGNEYVALINASAQTVKSNVLNVAFLILGRPNNWGAGQKCNPIEPVVDQQTITIDFNLCNVKSMTLSANGHTLGVPADLAPGYCGELFIKQGPGGPFSLAFNPIWKFTNNLPPALTNIVGGTDVLSYCSRDNNYIAAQLLPALPQ